VIEHTSKITLQPPSNFSATDASEAAAIVRWRSFPSAVWQFGLESRLSLGHSVCSMAK
jgi:hypothetical protein